MRDLPLFYRTCRVNLNGRVLTYPKLTIEFETRFATRGVQTGTLKIYNPSEETIAACEKQRGKSNPFVFIEAGYREDSGTCFIGEMQNFEHKKDKEETIEIKISDTTRLWTTARINQSFTGPINASQVIQSVLSSLDLKASIHLKIDKEYENGISFSNTSLQKAMGMLSRDTESDFFFRSGRATFLPQYQGVGRAIVLDKNTGLIKANKTGKHSYKIRSLFLYYIDAGSWVSLYNDILLRVHSGKKVFSSFSDSYIEFDAVRV